MTPERWERLKQLYSSALEMPVEERPQFVAQKCRDDHDLKHELDALLKANDEPTDTLDAPLLNLNDLYPAGKQALHDGDVLLRRFRIVRLLGAGGMGEVFFARSVGEGDFESIRGLRDLGGLHGGTGQVLPFVVACAGGDVLVDSECPVISGGNGIHRVRADWDGGTAEA